MLFAAVTGWVTHLRWWWWRRWCIIVNHTIFFIFCWNSFGMMVTRLAWTPHRHSSQPWPPPCNPLLLHTQTERPLLPHCQLFCHLTLLLIEFIYYEDAIESFKIVEYSTDLCWLYSSLIMNTLSNPLRLWKTKGGIFVSGNATCHYKYLWNRKKQTPPSCIGTAATSVFPLPVGPPPSYAALLLPVSFHCLLVHRSSTRCTLYPKFLVPSIPDTTAFSTSGVHNMW